MCETNTQGQNALTERLEQMIRIMEKRDSKGNKEMEKRESEHNKEMEKMALKLQSAEKQGSTPMNSVGTKEGRITMIRDMTGQSLAGVTTAALTSCRT